MEQMADKFIDFLNKSKDFKALIEKKAE